MAKALSAELMRAETSEYGETGGVSQNNRDLGFIPAFRDADTGEVYLSRNPDGTPAGCHRLDGLPEALIVERTEFGGVSAVKATVIAGFARDGRFYTRDEAARQVEREQATGPG